ncbi:MAG: bifunctional indole-3-glycerol phosphate synthase/phosphoribosylanthranilate isomerase [Bacteroides sp.]|nr:bifunctional indole-3-glycerol phosphate synthase/phosphoribosylanthranilate isomerase [Prevotella sp.]MCM1408504.1 bifunctional indole-3-glycerol phosphate synthase/phosphoribosylanthranilate isomerase [Treponema brennaborense]MCM1469335.1 bifunctional indole-3-glycerol phosphate synthase/phosphoribosylanthranilate isomerase [Bacteroides sp.]
MQHNAHILSQIAELRQRDLETLGPTFGCDVPQTRCRETVNFLPEKGAILEIKRASPSKGAIAEEIDVASAVRQYERAGARAVSVLTESRFFHGSLDDLIAAAKTASRNTALLRKDFLLDEREIDISFRCGADAVLLIARLLDAEKLRSMASAALRTGLAALIEIRTEDDIEKLMRVLDDAQTSLQNTPASADAHAHAESTARALPYCGKIVVGINSRDLTDFSIDSLAPICIRRLLKDACAQKHFPLPPVITESGIMTPRQAAFAALLDFHGFLAGEAAAKNPQHAGILVKSFYDAAERRAETLGGKNAAAAQSSADVRAEKDKPSASSAEAAPFWETLALRAHEKKRRGVPLVKICGITNEEDARIAAEAGADILGFVFFADSPRCVQADTVRAICGALRSSARHAVPLFVGVVTDTASPQARDAFALAAEHVLDAVQLHGFDGETCGAADASFTEDVLRMYPAVRIGSEEDIVHVRAAREAGFPRVLIDAKTAEALGGTGVRIRENLVRLARRECALWLAGGITAENVRSLIDSFQPELIDAASGVESRPGKKDAEKIHKLFREILRK